MSNFISPDVLFFLYLMNLFNFRIKIRKGKTYSGWYITILLRSLNLVLSLASPIFPIPPYQISIPIISNQPKINSLSKAENLKKWISPQTYNKIQWHLRNVHQGSMKDGSKECLCKAHYMLYNIQLSINKQDLKWSPKYFSS